MSENKKKVMLWTLAISLIVLFVVIMVLCITCTKQQNEKISYYNQKLEELEDLEEYGEAVEEDTSLIPLTYEEEIYNKAMAATKNPYDSEIYKKSDVEEEIISPKTEEPISVVEIENFDDVINGIFSTKGKEQLMNKINVIRTEDGKVYCEMVPGVYKSNYIETELLQQEVTETKEEYIAKSKYLADEDYVGDMVDYTGGYDFEESPFILVYENDKWLVEDFTLPY